MKRTAWKLFLLLAAIVGGQALSGQTCPREVIYKQIDTTQLKLYAHYPEAMDFSRKYPAMIFFFGGGWVNGNIGQFEPHARYFADRGIVCFLAEYRVERKHGTTPFDAVGDAKSAVRFLREQAGEFGVDPDRIVASGGSAGGHLAACCAVIEKYDDPADNLSVNARPNALILFNPVIDNGPGGYGSERIGEAYRDFSPLHNLHSGAPPTIMFLGTADALIPVATARYYQTVMDRVGSRCELFLYEGQPHGFFNYKFPEYYRETVRRADEFLRSLGYVEGPPVL